MMALPVEVSTLLTIAVFKNSVHSSQNGRIVDLQYEDQSVDVV
jgi:hypothetical protein